MIMLSLVDGVPRTLNLAEIIGYYVDHQVDVVTRRTQLRLAQGRGARPHRPGAADRARSPRRGHQDHPRLRRRRRGPHEADEARSSSARSRPTTSWTCRCAASRGWRARSSREEHKELLARIKYLNSLLKDPKKLRGVIKDELAEIRKKHADPRRTKIKADEGDLDVEDLIAEEDVVITVEPRRLREAPSRSTRSSARAAAARASRAPPSRKRTSITNVFITTTHHWLLFFTTKGKVYRVKAHEVPENTRQARGLYAANLPGVRRQRRRARLGGARPQGVRGGQVPAVLHAARAWSRRRRCPSTTRRARVWPRSTCKAATSSWTSSSRTAATTCSSSRARARRSGSRNRSPARWAAPPRA